MMLAIPGCIIMAGPMGEGAINVGWGMLIVGFFITVIGRMGSD